MEERPRERCLSRGARALSLRECIAVVLGSGNRGRSCLDLARDILERPGPGLPPGELERALFTALEISAPAHLGEHPGLGDAGRARLLAAFEIGRRYAQFRLEQLQERPSRRGGRIPLPLPERAVTLIPPELRTDSREWLGFIPLHRSSRLGSFCLVERGVRTHVNVDPVELFARILALRPAGLFLFHNHPSGDLTPSDPDIELTHQADRMAAQFGIRLLGHGIVTARGERWVVV